jgi:hypothetical protein
MELIRNLLNLNNRNFGSIEKFRLVENRLKARLHFDFLLLMDVNEWISYECSDEGTCTSNIRNSCIYFVHMHQEKALEIAAEIASVNGPVE